MLALCRHCRRFDHSHRRSEREELILGVYVPTELVQALFVGHMRFSRIGTGVTGLTDVLCIAMNTGVQTILMGRGCVDVVEYTVSRRIETGHDSGAGGTAVWRGRVGLGERDPFRGQSFHVGHAARVVGPDDVGLHLIDEKNENVGSLVHGVPLLCRRASVIQWSDDSLGLVNTRTGRGGGELYSLHPGSDTLA